MESPSIGWVEPGLVGGPEPSVDVFGEELITVTAIKVTQTTRGPDIFGLCKTKRLDKDSAQ